MQTNSFVQTVQTSILATGSTFKGASRGVRGVICKSVIRDGRLIIKLSNSPCTPPWMLIQWPRLKFARFARIGWFAPDMFPHLNGVPIFMIVINGSSN